MQEGGSPGEQGNEGGGAVAGETVVNCLFVQGQARVVPQALLRKQSPEAALGVHTAQHTDEQSCP